MGQQTLNGFVFANGTWSVGGREPPDRNIPANLVPPGVTTPGFWTNWSWKVGPDGRAWPTSRWFWVPLPTFTWGAVTGPNGVVVPTIGMGYAALVDSASGVVNGKLVDNVALRDHPWPMLVPTLGTAKAPKGSIIAGTYPAALPPPTSWPSFVTPPPPVGWSGGTVQQMSTVGRGFIYNNGQAQASSSALAIAVVVGAVTVGGGAALFMP